MKPRIAEMYRESQRELYAENQELIAALRDLLVLAEMAIEDEAVDDARALLARIDGKEQEG